METIYLAGGCLWGIQAFVKTIPGVVMTEAGRANGYSAILDGPYDGYVECVKTIFDPSKIDVTRLIDDLFEIIDPYSLNQQGEDVGPKYRTGIYSEQSHHLIEARQYIQNRADAEYIMVEVAPLTNYIPSADVHQDHLDKYPNDYCHIPDVLMRKYR
ncbi:peptide-methionine (S)-S-oxide reductase [Staphylococcus pseudintermedius]|uniref:peptide-methionine (S)-S-oxide reductase n=1 Tax=Staphylococcus pseudintermedius TaxID=283734 RepID=UPI000CFBBDDA|nr:peptide-methionine (S)-S-oxide reductase [Staphylococcus pseudintermedius]EGQ0378258.1 peptide-methionine (S)-S-oxide reductase [Staphylococcus pseudintermedius]EGQ0383932.1 peptide-methionine (S)-S-oxide reductase [Staphylococcus pseudintermedius]EGQ0387771.1 peptide-methionine (S)-S-oxide reductase [Staphylococcus pseudintermedius]EGQ1301851.1 peptide-methionine (S)-S-oxide reductase [Staphylococcus pseudintermedius]EGQ1311267.1 peptide-methionine (S)-S-oxide reductase [Staphylococcus pse